MKIPFLFGIHCHQPADNFSHVVDWAVNVSYAPFLKEALNHKDFKFAVHYSGWLLEYIRNNHKDVFKNLKTLASNGQVEFFTGGFYEPVLSAIPSDDRRGQIKMLSDYIKKHFGQSPNGMWLTERVWDPAIIPDITEVGVENLIVDDYHLIAAGFPEASITGYFTTEQDGCKVNLFPIDRMLRYLTPFKPEKEVTDYITSLKDKNIKLVTCFDDGEKFGVWPSTFEWVYEKGWLDRFIESVTTSEEIEFMHYKDAVAKIKPSGIAYLPITSYVEMGEWSLFADRFEKFEEMKEYLEASPYKNDTEQFLKGSIWKNFLVKYPESNRLHKKTLDLSLRGKPYKKNKEFLDLLYRSQCNDSLWHGIFGGLYLPNLRDNAWKPLIEAETLYEKLAGLKLPLTEVRDVDYDGYLEAYHRNENFNALFVSRDGGQMTSLELKDKNWNLLGTIARRKEGYHANFLKANIDESHNENIENVENEENKEESSSIHDKSYSISDEMKNKLSYDWYNKNCFIDHFTNDFNIDDFERCSFAEFGDFANQPAELIQNKDKIKFLRQGGLYAGGQKTNAYLEKTFTVNNKGINFEVQGTADNNFTCKYVLENNFHFADWKLVKLNGKPLEEKGTLSGKKFVLKDSFTEKEVTLEFDKDVTFGWYVIYTVSQSEAGVDLTAQGVTFLSALDFYGNLNLKCNIKIK